MSNISTTVDHDEWDMVQHGGVLKTDARREGKEASTEMKLWKRETETSVLITSLLLGPRCKGQTVLL